MKLKDAILKRRMVRNFADKPIEPEIIERIVYLTRHAPSAGFTQGQSFIVVTKSDLRKAIADTCEEDEYVKSGFDPFISKAPVLLIPCTSELLPIIAAIKKPTKRMRMVLRSFGPCLIGLWISAAQS